jgi:4-hydroxy-3-polyprenylbenzoate decarboxylase
MGWLKLADYVEALDKSGKLVRISIPINKDTELQPLVRLQFRGLAEGERKAFLFENVVDSRARRYDIPVLVAAMAGSADIYALGMGCGVEDIPDKWAQALAHPIPPRVVSAAPCQEVRISGEALSREGGGLGRLPIPISTPGFDNAPYTSASHFISKDPVTGLHNVGNYRGMVKAENRIGVLPANLGWGLRRHIDMWREQGAETMPAAIAIGVPPAVTYTAVTRIPNDVSEYDVAGGIMGSALDVIRGLTQDILVPAQAEIIIEGTIPTSLLEVEGAFGEFHGYMAKRDYSFYMDVSCITMRRKPIYLAIISQMPPSESSKLRGVGRNAAGKKFLHDAGFKNVLAVNYIESVGSYAIVVVKLRKEKPDDGKQVLQALAQRFIGKFAIAVDEDINIDELESVMWAVSYRSQPYRDVKVVDVPFFSLDPSVAPFGEARGLVSADGPPRSSALLIDATIPWPYPPISLPKKEYMERAMTIWKELQLPALTLKDPWFGYPLGYWAEEEAREADLAVTGRHYETGEKLRGLRRPFK